MVDVPVTPLASGNRDKVDRTITFTTDYEPVLIQIVAQASDQSSADIREIPAEIIDEIGLEMSVAIPINEITSIRPFDLDTYLLFDEPSN